MEGCRFRIIKVNINVVRFRNVSDLILGNVVYYVNDGEILCDYF